MTDWVEDEAMTREETLARFAALHPEPTKPLPWWIPCCSRRPLVCRLDNLMHGLHMQVRWLCNLHERNITGDWSED